MKIYEVLVFDDLTTSDGLNPAKFSEFLNHVLVFSKKHPRAGDRNYSSNSLHDITNQRRHTAEDSWGMRAIFFSRTVYIRILYLHIYLPSNSTDSWKKSTLCRYFLLKKVGFPGFGAFGPARLFLPWRKASKMLWVPGWRGTVLAETDDIWSYGVKRCNQKYYIYKMPELCNSRNVHTLVSSMCAVCVCALCSLWLFFTTYLHMLRCHELVVLFDHCDLLGHRLGNNRLLQEADVLMCGQPLCWTLESVVWGWETKANSTSVSNVCLLKDIPNTWRIVDVFVNLRNFARHLCWYALLTYCFFFFLLNMISTSFNDSGMV